MGKRSKTPKRMISLDEQLLEHDRNEPPGPAYRTRFGDARLELLLEAPSSERMAWVRRRLELVDDIRRRDAKRLRDPGRDASGNFDVPSYAARGHRVDVAPKALGKELPKDSQFPRRIVTQRVIDRLKARGTISHREWQAADLLWSWWSAALTGDRLVAAYSPVSVHTSPNTDRLVTKRLEAAESYLGLIGLVPERCKGIVTHVVINDWELSDWGLRTAKSGRARRRQAAKLLSRGLSALAKVLGY